MTATLIDDISDQPMRVVELTEKSCKSTFLVSPSILFWAASSLFYWEITLESSSWIKDCSVILQSCWKKKPDAFVRVDYGDRSDWEIHGKICYPGGFMILFMRYAFILVFAGARQVVNYWRSVKRISLFSRKLFDKENSISNIRGLKLTWIIPR